MALVNERRPGLAQTLIRLFWLDKVCNSAHRRSQSARAKYLGVEAADLKKAHKRLHGLRYGFGLVAVG
jgi:hypothetical protein